MLVEEFECRLLGLLGVFAAKTVLRMVEGDQLHFHVAISQQHDIEVRQLLISLDRVDFFYYGVRSKTGKPRLIWNWDRWRSGRKARTGRRSSARCE